VLCNANVEETLGHLFFECTFSAWCWSFVGVTWDNSLPIILERLQAARAAFGSPIFFENCHFDSLLYLVSEEQSHL